MIDTTNYNTRFPNQQQQQQTANGETRESQHMYANYIYLQRAGSGPWLLPMAWTEGKKILKVISVLVDEDVCWTRCNNPPFLVTVRVDTIFMVVSCSLFSGPRSVFFSEYIFFFFKTVASLSYRSAGAVKKVRVEPALGVRFLDTRFRNNYRPLHCIVLLQICRSTIVCPSQVCFDVIPANTS